MPIIKNKQDYLNHLKDGHDFTYDHYINAEMNDLEKGVDNEKDL